MIRLLNIHDDSDVKAIREIVLGRNSWMRAGYQHTEVEVGVRVEQWRSVNALVVGYEEDVLLSFMVASPWKWMPYYTLASLFTRTGQSFYKNGHGEIFDVIIETMESAGRYTFYLARINKWGITGKNEKTKPYGKLYDRYDRFVEEVVPANTEAKYETHRNILGYRTWPINTAIVRCSLMAKFRPYYEEETRVS